MNLYSAEPVKVEPGQWVVAWRGKAEAHLITRKLPKRYFFRENVGRNMVENFLTPEQVLSIHGANHVAAFRRAHELNEYADLVREKVKQAHSEFATAIRHTGLRVDP